MTERSGSIDDNLYAAYFKPESTAGRILEFANSILGRFQQNEGSETDEIEEMLQMLIEAIEEGFNQARESLSDAPDAIHQLVDKIENLIKTGLGQGNEQSVGEQGIAGQFSMAMSYYSETIQALTSQEVSVTA